MIKDEALDLALEALEYIENNYMSLPKSGTKAITAIKQARSAPAQEPVAFNAGVPPLYPEMKDGETISVEYTTPPGGRQSEDCLTAAQEDIQRLSALVRAQQITIDKLEQDRSAPVQEPVARVSLQWLAEMILSDCGHSSNYTPLLDRVKARIEQWERANSAPTPPAPAPVPKPWVGLTDEEILKLAYPIRWQEVDDFEADKAVNFAQMVEAKLKEKNGGVV
jgi:hypothetical protein